VQGNSDNNIISYNNISESQTGIFVESSGNMVYGNSILDNVVQAEDRARMPGMRTIRKVATSGATTLERI